MSFVHEDGEFGQLLDIVARETGIAAALIEKDYRVTHTLWALHGSGLDIWFKGGTSLSKGFALILPFSEDLDLMIQPGSVGGLPEVGNWTSTNIRAPSEPPAGGTVPCSATRSASRSYRPSPSSR